MLEQQQYQGAVPGRYLRTPPFGRILIAYQQEKINPRFPIYIHVGKDSKEEAYNNKRNGLLCSYLPEGEDFANYAWPVEGWNVVLFASSNIAENHLKKMCLHLLKICKVLSIYVQSDNPEIPHRILTSRY